MSNNDQNSGIDQARKRAQLKKKKRKDSLSMKKARNIIGSIIVLAQLVLSVIFIGHLDKLDVLPMKYFSIVFAVMIILFTVFALLELPKKTHIFAKVISVILCAVFTVGIVYMSKTLETMDKISNAAQYTTNEYSVVVLKDSTIKELKDLSGKKVGIMNGVENESRDKVISDIEKETSKSLNLREYSGIQELSKALVEGKIDAAIYRSSYVSVITDTYETYEEDTRIIKTMSVKMEVKKDDKFALDPAGITNKSFIVLLSGTDAEGNVSAFGRSDSNILAIVNPQTCKILLVSTPRDSYVPIVGVSATGQRDKLTHSGNEGVETTVKTINKIYGIDIDYYAKFNFESFVGIVNILGGITVDSELEFTTTGGFHFDKGKNDIKEGIVALQFARERHAFADGDFQRGRNQMAIIKGVINKALSPAILTSYLDIMDVATDIVYTNFPPECVTELVKYQLNENCKWTVESINATGNAYTTSSGASVVDLDDKSIADIRKKIIATYNGD